jgi:cation-transporting ATPase E
VTATLAAGLSDEEVAQCVAEGKSNDVPARAARSVSEILRANVFTRINAILGVLLIIVLTTGSVINGLFGILIVANSAIGIIQELRAKRTLDELAIVCQAKPMVRRQSGTTARPPNEVVLGDVIELGPGDHILVDGDLLEEDNLEVDGPAAPGVITPVALVVLEQRVRPDARETLDYFASQKVTVR